MSFAKSRKTLIQKIVFTIIQFLVIAAVAFLSLYILKLIGLVNKEEVVNLLVVFTAIYFILDLFGTSFDLMKTLYFAEDNKLLVTYPVSAGELFLSKIIVYFFFELRKTAKMLLPIVVGFVLSLLTTTVDPHGTQVFTTQISIAGVFTIIPTLLFLSAFTVVLGALISVPLLYIYQFIKRRPIIELILTIILVGGFIYLSVFLINLIKAQGEIIVSSWIGRASNAIKVFVNKGSLYAAPIRELMYMITGEFVSYGYYRFNLMLLAKFGIVIAGIAALSTLVYFAIKPFYFYIMTSGSEFDNNDKNKNKTNHVLSKYITFTKKELIISIRDVEISGSYIAIYILVPILLMFIDAIYGAISTNLSGQTMTLAFNLLLILTPLLASNSLVASLYSKEGRAAYIKKTKPINPLVPLASKLIFNLVLSVPCVIACGVVFADFSHISASNIVLISLAVLFLQYVWD